MSETAGRPEPGVLTGWPYALLRIGIGVMFFRAGVDKLMRGESWPEGMAGWVQSKLESAFGFYQGFLEHVVLPNHELFAHLVSWGELLLGIALILGIGTRYAAVAGSLMLLNFWFAKGEPFWSAANHDAIIILIFLAFAVSSAGRVLGLDQHFARRWPWLHL